MTSETRPVRIGVDIGGTFTDLQIFDARGGRTETFKVPTTSDDPSIGLMDGVRGAAERFGFALGDVGYVMHGTTIATNAVLERKLPRGALVATSGFEDVLEIGRHVRREIYSMRPRPAPTLIARNLRLGVAERIRADGSVEKALELADLERLAERITALEVECVAIVLLNAYLNPAHERAVRDHLARRLPDLPVCISAQISPEIREYERSSTTVLNALLMPVVRRYLTRLKQRMAGEGFDPRLLIVQSNGGVCSPETAAEEPVRLLLSGPSGGALGSLILSRELQQPALVGIDMGGTSFDVSVVRDDRVGLITQGELDRLPVRVPMVEIRTIGAGGGSIASVDAGRRLTVGPESAGAHPGPVCYGRGGALPTVTDANLVLGRLDPAYFLGGAMKLDLEATRVAIAAKAAQPLGLSLEAAAAGILTVTNANLGAAIRLSLFEKGLDPRDFAILSFGGAGSLHAIEVAEQLGVRRVIFPNDASTFSAWGILHCDITHDFARSRVMVVELAALPALQAMAAEMTAEAAQRLDGDGVPPADREMLIAADLRYRGQAFELTVGWPGNDVGALEPLLQAFHEQHRQRFSYANPDEVVEIVTLRLSARGRLPHPQDRRTVAAGSGAAAGRRALWVGDQWLQVPVWRRGALAPAQRIAGPAIVEEDYTTVYIAPGWTLSVRPDGNLVATKD
jgi:N-methylhydantoinase A